MEKKSESSDITARTKTEFEIAEQDALRGAKNLTYKLRTGFEVSNAEDLKKVEVPVDEALPGGEVNLPKQKLGDPGASLGRDKYYN